MVAFLNKLEGSEGFQQIVDFLNTSHIKFALTENPTINTSLIQQFWQTASTSTIEDGEVEITEHRWPNSRLITEAIVLEDIHQVRTNAVGPIQHDEGSTVPVESITHLRSHTPGSDEGRMQQTELMVLVIKLSDRVLALETDLQQTKKVYCTTVTKLIMKVKRLEKIVKSSKARRRAKIVVSDDEEVLEDSSKQGRMIDDIYQDAGITLVTPTKTSTQEDHPEDHLGVLSAAKILIDVARVHTYSRRRRRTVSTGSGEVSTASRIISTAKETVI
ncbi:hypothetical protein Tco_0614448 [Tanacetum coccineum]